MQQALEKMKDSLYSILGSNLLSVYLYGSVVLDDFKLGWSDIDLLCFTQHTVTKKQAEMLLPLRQTLLEEDPQNQYYGCFEGVIVTLQEFQSQCFSKVVVWGTGGQKITDQYYFDAFSQYQLIKGGFLLDGTDLRAGLSMPSYSQLREEVIRHYHTIRTYAVQTSSSLYACGWLLDIARGIYTLRTGEVISKTQAGEWAIRQNLCPVKNELLRTLEIRNQPL